MAEILLLEDSESLRRVLKHSLHEEGHAVTESCDGAIAYDRSTVSRVALAITDIDMPRVNGIEAILTMRKLSPALPIIAMSGGGSGDDDDYLNVCKELGVVAVLKKPFEPEDMVSVVRMTLND